MMKILVVDDSVVFRSQISSALLEVPGVQVVGTAANGKIALQKLEQLSVDLVTLDMEMPELSGLETIQAMRSRGFKTKIIVFSSQTTRGAERALTALRAGADDVIAKPEGDHLNFETALAAIKSALIPKVLQFVDPLLRKSLEREPLAAAPTPATFSASAVSKVKTNLTTFSADVAVIASSTGGPNTLEAIFGLLKKGVRKPILMVQHMPPVFTQLLAKRLSEVSGLDVAEGQDGEVVRDGRIYIAPGDYHMTVERAGSNVVVRLNQGPSRNSVRPAADFLFESAADVYGSRCLGIVLTGMGADGAVGAQYIRNRNGAVFIQNRETCVVFGMPGAVYESGEYDGIGDPAQVAELLHAKMK